MVNKARATGTFDVTLSPLPSRDGAPAGTARMSIDKRFTGDLDGVSNGEMLTVGTAVAGSAGYVAIERVTATLHGRSGEFVLQHSGTMTRGDGELTITVVPDSGTGELEGLVGTMTIELTDAGHAYSFDYSV